MTLQIQKENIQAFFGLGNPEPQYTNTYHSIGFKGIDQLFLVLGNEQKPFGDLKKHQTHYDYAKTNSLSFGKSTLFMNDSGQAVSSFIKNLGLDPSKLVIIHDDSDIAIGNSKLSFGRGHAGHNGIKSVTSSLGTKNFWRLRIGIRNPKTRKGSPASKFVLSTITKDDSVPIEQSISKAAEFLSKSLNSKH